MRPRRRHLTAEADFDRRARPAPPCSLAGLLILLAATPACRGTSGPRSDTARIIGPRGGEVSSSDGVVRLVIPSGALAVDTEISIQAAGEGGGWVPGGVAGTAYEFKPDGLTFERPARLTIRYSPSRLPRGARESSLALARLRDDGRLELAPELRVDEAARTVTGTITGFSGYGVLQSSVPGMAPRKPAQPRAEHLVPGDFRFRAGPRLTPPPMDQGSPEEEPQ